jgi:hypothetical protein
MAGRVCCLSRRAFVLGTLGTALAAGAARAQAEGAPVRVPVAPPVVPDCA